MDGHILTGSQNKNIIGKSVAHGHGKSAANHIPQHIIQDNIGGPFFESAFFLQSFQCGNDASSGTSDTGGRATGFDTDHAAVALPADVAEFKRKAPADQIKDGRDLFAPEQLRRGISLGITSDLKHFQSLFSQCQCDI